MIATRYSYIPYFLLLIYVGKLDFYAKVIHVDDLVKL